MGEPLPYMAKLEIAEPIKTLTAEYTDSCGQLAQFGVGARIEQALIEGAHRTFKAVLYETEERKDRQSPGKHAGRPAITGIWREPAKPHTGPWYVINNRRVRPVAAR